MRQPKIAVDLILKKLTESPSSDENPFVIGKKP